VARSWHENTAPRGNAFLQEHCDFIPFSTIQHTWRPWQGAVTIWFNVFTEDRKNSMKYSTSGRAMAQAVNRRPLTAESRLHARVNPCGICGGQSGTATGFSLSSSVFSCQYHSTVVLHTHVSSGGWTVCLLVAAVQRRSLTSSKSTNYSTSCKTDSHSAGQEIPHRLSNPKSHNSVHKRLSPIYITPC
jgi:hypothetical protein